MEKTTKKKLTWCRPHKKELSKEESSGGGWLNSKPICPACEYERGYRTGMVDKEIMRGKDK